MGVRFGTDGWRATLDEFTTERVRTVAQGVASYLDDEGRGGEPVAVGYDARDTSRGFAEEVARVLCVNGHDALVPPRDCPTPVAAWAVVDRGLAGAIVITASHNPPEYNGVKFIPHDGAPASLEVTDAIEDRLASPLPAPRSAWGRVKEVDFVGPHADHAIDLVQPDLDGLTVAYDAMHGSGRGVTDALLERAGATVERVRCDAVTDFGGISPEPAPAHLAPLVEAVDSGADLGIANDGDADRLGVVTPERGVLDENFFFAALYDYLLEHQSGPAVRTVSTTFLIDRIAEAHGTTAIETPVGFKWVAEAMAAHDALVGGEASGGFSVRGHVRDKDGVLMALYAAAMEAERPIDDRVEAVLETYGQVVADSQNVTCEEHEKASVIQKIGTRLPDAIAGVLVERVNDADGFKVLLEDGSWLLIRPSGTEPKLRLYAEASASNRVDALLEAGRDLVEQVR